jgi:hypothetical protein
MSQPDIARRCPACGVSLRTRAQFCPQCGSSLGAPQASVPQTESPRKQPSPTPDSQAETQGLSPLPRELVSKTQSNKGKNTGYANKAPSEYATIASGPSGESGLTTRVATVADTEGKKPAREKRRSKALVESSADPSLKFLIVTAVIFLVAALLVILSRVIE